MSLWFKTRRGQANKGFRIQTCERGMIMHTAMLMKKGWWLEGKLTRRNISPLDEEFGAVWRQMWIERLSESIYAWIDVINGIKEKEVGRSFID